MVRLRDRAHLWLSVEALLCVLLLLPAAPASAGQTRGGTIAVTFGPNEVWNPSQSEIGQLQACGQPTLTCVQQVMQQSGASSQAAAFYRLTGWFLSALKGGSPVQLGTVFNPWRANENEQPALLGGSPDVVLPETEVASIETDSWSPDPMFASLKARYPNLMFWGSGPDLELIDVAPGGGQRFIFDYRMLDGCHACATVAIARIAFDFLPDGTYLAATQLNLAPPPPGSGG